MKFQNSSDIFYGDGYADRTESIPLDAIMWFVCSSFRCL